MRPKLGTLALAASLVLAVDSPASARVIVIDKARARGDFATAVASGNVRKPKRLWVKVKSRPHQRATGSYSVVCTKGSGAGSRSGNFSGRTPFRRRLRKPYRRPDSCTVAASAQLKRGGRLTVILLARK
jgi:hypothetical protein